MSFLPLKARRKVLFLFARITEPWYAKVLQGFNHMAIAEVIDEGLLFIIEPTTTGALSRLHLMPKIGDWDHITVLELDLRTTKTSKLVRPTFQTCATLCQYLAGINLGCHLVQSLYERLTMNNITELNALGVLRVKQWQHQVNKAQPLS